MPVFCVFYTQKVSNKCQIWRKKCKLSVKFTLFLYGLHVNLHVKRAAGHRYGPFFRADRHMRFLYGCLTCLFAAYFSRKWSPRSVSPDRVPYAIFSCLFILSATATYFPKLDFSCKIWYNIKKRLFYGRLYIKKAKVMSSAKCRANCLINAISLLLLFSPIIIISFF